MIGGQAARGALDTGGRILLDTPRIWRGSMANSISQLLLHFIRPGMSSANEEDLPKYAEVGGLGYVIPPIPPLLRSAIRRYWPWSPPPDALHVV